MAKAKKKTTARRAKKRVRGLSAMAVHTCLPQGVTFLPGNGQPLLMLTWMELIGLIQHGVPHGVLSREALLWMAGRAPTALDFDTLQRISIARCESEKNGFNQKLDEWTLLEWAGAMCGEAGEAANVAKKLRRKRIQRGDDKATVELLGEELSDTVCYAVLTAARAGLDLGEVIVAKFNKVSKEIGSTLVLVGKKAA